MRSFCTFWKLRLIDFRKVAETQHRIQCLWFLSLLPPEIEIPWIRPPLCVIHVHICLRMHWNRSPCECYWFSLPFHVCWNEVSSSFLLSGRRFLMFCQKVRMCCRLQLSKRPHRDLTSQSCCAKYAIQNFTISALIVRMWCNYDRPVRFHTQLNQPNVCSMHTPESLRAHFCVPNCRGRHPARACSRQIPENDLR